MFYQFLLIALPFKLGTPFKVLLPISINISTLVSVGTNKSRTKFYINLNGLIHGQLMLGRYLSEVVKAAENILKLTYLGVGYNIC
jgi:hypothetical protein